MKYKVLIDFTDKYDATKDYKKGDIVEFTKKRAKEILSVGLLIEEYKEPECDKKGVVE